MKKILDGNRYSDRSTKIVKGLSFFAFIAFVATLWLLYVDAEIGLKIVWYIIIPLAPVIFLLIPNIWTALCPLAFLQSLPKRFNINRDKYLNRRQTRFLNIGGIVLLYLLVPARYFIFNIEGQISFYTLLALLVCALIFGFFFTGLSGWCMGLCPIRPVELMYAQFNIEKRRPEVCTTCDLCVANCPRLNTDDQEKVSKYNTDFLWFIYSFPGFILGYYIVHPEELYYFIYLKIFGLALVSLLVFKGIDKLLKKRDSLYISIILSIIIYYVNILPSIADAWYINERFQSLLYIVPFTAIFYSILSVLPQEKKTRFFLSIGSLSFLYFSITSLFSQKSLELNNFNWQEHAYKVGNKACATCHADIAHEYAQSEMGTSFSLMSPLHTDLPIDSSKVYDEKSDFHYEIVKRKDEYFMTEKRFDEDGAITHELEFKIDYVIGSGHNTKSFVMNRNGYFYEMPITWYTKRKKWDMSPGYQNYNIRFFRETTQKCIDCHTEETTFEDYSENRFLKVNHGIDCEKCHGPGSLHVEKQSGKRNLAFRAIINPAKDEDQDNMVCYDCHSKKEIHYLEDVDDKVIDFTAHSTRLSLSKCFTKGEITCITCHDPHKKLSKTKLDLNKPCLSCHSVGLEKIPKHEKSQDCVSCHMPRKGSSDIPHVNPTEHWIKVYDKTSDKYSEGLNKDYMDYIVPESRSTWEKKRAATFLQRYRESIGSKKLRTDTLNEAYSLMEKQWFLTPKEKQTYATILYFTKRYKKAEALFKKMEGIDIEFYEPDPEYFYFFGKTYRQLKNNAEAERYLIKGLKEYPNHILTMMELSNLYFENKEFETSFEYVKKIIKLNPLYRDALYQKGYIEQFGYNDLEGALKSYGQLLALYPDDHDGLLNSGFINFQSGYIEEGFKLFDAGLKRYPRSQKLLANMARFKLQSGDLKDGEKYMNLLNKYYPSNPFRNPLLQMINQLKSSKIN